MLAFISASCFRLFRVWQRHVAISNYSVWECIGDPGMPNQSCWCHSGDICTTLSLFYSIQCGGWWIYELCVCSLALSFAAEQIAWETSGSLSAVFSIPPYATLINIHWQSVHYSCSITLCFSWTNLGRWLYGSNSQTWNSWPKKYYLLKVHAKTNATTASISEFE